jgi:hypothetical protein
MKDVIVTGGRDYDDFAMVQDVLSLFDIGLLIQGGAFGADEAALEYAKHNTIECVTVAADWDKHGRGAGPIRNKEMLLKYPNAIVVAFPGGAGTANCVKAAVALNRIVLQVHK